MTRGFFGLPFLFFEGKESVRAMHNMAIFGIIPISLFVFSRKSRFSVYADSLDQDYISDVKYDVSIAIILMRNRCLRL